jgi:hypothetical protein
MWSLPLKTGGHVEPSGENQLAIMVLGWILGTEALTEFRINSPDLTGDQVVNLSDLVVFAGTYMNGYDYACDFRWDGVLNLSDVVFLAQAMGTECP